MNLKEVRDLLKDHDLLISYANLEMDQDQNVASIAIDTKGIKEGSVFICRQGYRYDSHALVDEAIHLGVKAIVVERPVNIEHIPIFLVRDSRMAEAILASSFFGSPHEKLKVYGVTGTNGKTTISTMIHFIMNMIGKSGSLVGTVNNVVVDRTIDSVNTTPPALDIAQYARETLDKGGEFLSVEVSSHALTLKRVESLRFDVGILTNITQDHLDFHKNMDDYAMTKFQLFRLLKEKGTAILNIEDPYASRFVSMLPMDVHVVTYGLNGCSNKPDYSADCVKIGLEGVSFDLLYKGKKIGHVHSPLIGMHNVSNLLAVIALLLREGIPLEEILLQISRFRGVEGRFEIYTRVGQDIDLVIDFAHTPDALQKTLETAKMLTRNRIIAVFGAGGEADIGKRPIMGKIASDLCDVAIVTSDNPKSEKPMEIIRQIEEGISHQIPYLLIEDRRIAIETALNIAGKGDMVILAGKGHERFQIVGGTYLPFSDRDIAFQMVRDLKRRVS